MGGANGLRSPEEGQILFVFVFFFFLSYFFMFV